MAKFENPIIIDGSKSVILVNDQNDIILPWYCSLGIEKYSQVEGYDRDKNHYTWFIYDLPTIFESSEMHCLVSWSSQKTKIYVGESKAMDIIFKDYKDVQWETDTNKG